MKSRIMGSFRWDIVELAGNLRQEHLFISSEQQNLQNLNTKVDCVSSSLAQLAWVTAQQRDNLNQLIVARPDCTPASCCHKANTLESTTFVDGYKVLGFQECMSYGQFLQNLRNSPQLLASCLVIGDKMLPADVMTSVAHCIGSGLLGSSLLPNDKMLALQLLRHLTELQLVPSENPRRLLRQKSCAFARLYGEFHEGLFSAKLFLTAALHNPIMQLLMEDEMFLDIDPDKATIRFPQEERLKKFGAEGTPEYYKRLAEYRKWTNNRLVSVTNRFVSSLRENMHCFPFGICWLVRQIADLLSKSPNSDPKEVHAICTDLVFTYFICPAIVNPEPYGITDAPISYIARFNLIQVAQIVQTLAMIKYEDVGSKVADLYSHFSKDCVASILDMILDEEASSINVELTVEQNSKLCGLTRSAALFTETELHTLVSFLQSVLSESQLDTSIIDKEQLVALIRQLPASCNNNNIGNSPKVQPKVASPPDTPNKRTGFLGKVSRNRNISTSPASSSGVEESGTDDDLGERGPDVLVIPFRLDLEGNIGLIPEQKVLCMDDTVESHVRVSLPDDSSSGSNIVERAESQEKRTRFSLLHDEGSIGNTSDNLEAVSEAASNHSVASSLELENEDQNDNLSDMVSANVSGRGTPNISGRDTPSSQITEGEDGQVGMLRGSAGESRQTLDFPPTSANKQSRSDIDDKFGKFEIKKLIEGDETVSMVSDTWSTDVLASDSETIEQSERSFSVNAAESAIQQLAETTQMLDISETASEAWSTDVLASDSERLTEVDTDDTGSVARSDDTARSEVEAEGRTDTEGGEETPPSSAYGLNATFRPIKGDEVNGRQMLLIPISPTRIDAPANPVWNVTGRGGGKADYRRRTVEYVDNNANNIILRRESAVDFIKHAIQNVEETPLIHVIDKIDKSSDVKASVPTGGQTIINIPSPVVMVPPIANQAGSGILAQTGPMTLPHFTNGGVTFSTNHPAMVPSIPNTPQIVGVPNVDLELKQELVEDDLDQESVGEAMLNVVRLSSASLASSSSSGSSSEPRPKTATPTPDIPLPSPLVVNGHAMMLEGSQIVTKTNQASSSTGAIPKSISFDKTAERGDKDLLDEDSKHKRSFFRNFKLPFKSRRFKTQRSGEELGHRSFDGSLSGVDGDMTQPRLRCRGSEEIHPSSSDTTEDILAKYRRKPGTTSSLSSDQNVESTNPVKHKQPIDERLKIDPSNIEASYAFIDAKRKLRMVLSTADLQYGPWMPNSSFGKKAAALNKDNELVSFLQLQLAEAINLHNRSLIAHLHETLRCIRRFDDDGCCKLFLSLQDDYSKRSPYIAYLVRCKQGLLSTLTHLERMMDRVKCDKDVCNKFLISVCVRMFLERREQMLVAFQSEFQQLTLADEKTDLLDKFLHTLSLEMDRDPTWQAASGAQIEQAHTAIERAVISRVYLQAIYPNGDGDISRDQVLHEHMKKLADVITPDHKDLRIPKMFHYECPWPSAQAEIVAISAYKTPRDKLLCVFRCATTIMNLLSMACESGVPAADDFVPVLVYVLIKANPPSLLSTVQYVNSFYGSRLEGEDQYWWIQFCSAIEFIKTMDYSD